MLSDQPEIESPRRTASGSRKPSVLPTGFVEGISPQQQTSNTRAPEGKPSDSKVVMQFRS
jgi:hypothetical protein